MWLFGYIKSIHRQLEQMKGILMQIADVLDEINNTTNETASRVTALLDSIRKTNGTLTPAQETEASAIIGHLKGIAADQSTPVPEPPPATPLP